MTGGGRGLGLACAAALAGAGYRVCCMTAAGVINRAESAGLASGAWNQVLEVNLAGTFRCRRAGSVIRVDGGTVTDGTFF